MLYDLILKSLNLKHLYANRTLEAPKPHDMETFDKFTTQDQQQQRFSLMCAQSGTWWPISLEFFKAT